LFSNGQPLTKAWKAPLPRVPSRTRESSKEAMRIEDGEEEGAKVVKARSGGLEAKESCSLSRTNTVYWV